MLSRYLLKSLLLPFSSLSGMKTYVNNLIVALILPDGPIPVAQSSSWLYCTYLCPGDVDQHLRCQMVRRVRVHLLDYQT